MRRTVFAGNWKMNRTGPEGGQLAMELKKRLAGVDGPEIIVAPPFTTLSEVARNIKGSNICLAGQNIHWEKSGAYTGEISAPMLKAAGCSHVIVGHSERRHLFGDTDELINKRTRAALEHGLTPIFCIGETLKERESNKMWEVLTRQVVQGLAGIHQDTVTSIIVAYEPVWAIGTGKVATAEQAQEAHSFLRSLLAESYPGYVSQAVRLLYGGSVKPSNIAGLMAQHDVDGVLVGGASLSAENFEGIVKHQPVN